MSIRWTGGSVLPLVFLSFGLMWSCGGDKAESPAQDPDSPGGAPAEPGAVGQPAPGLEQAGATGPFQDLLPHSFAPPGLELLQRSQDLDLDGAFQTVARGIRYEPYQGVLRGAAETALVGSGNDLDQAVLLAKLLQQAGYRTRFARGRLDLENQLVLLRGMANPTVPTLDLTPDYFPYDATEDEALLALTRDHFWVEVYQTPEWLPLDPSFPRAEPGEAYARADARFDDVPEDLYHRVRIVYREETASGGERELGVIQGTAMELGLRPLTLAVRAVPQSPVGPVSRGGSPAGITGGLAGALGGARPKEDEPETVNADDLVGISYQRSLRANGIEETLPSTFLLEEERDGGLEREWLEIELTGPGVQPIQSRRILFDSERSRANQAEPPAVRRYTVSVIPGPVPQKWLQGERERWRGYLDLGEWNVELEASARLEPGKDAADAALRLARMEAAAGTGAGHLMALTYAAESDSLARLIAPPAGVVPVWSRPRVLISSFETSSLDPTETETTVSLDLRIDGIEAYPLPGAASRGAQLFQTARGLQNSVLEGAVVTRATGITVPVTTANLMQRVDEEVEDGLVVVGVDHSAEALAQVQGLPSTCSPLIQDALDRGRDVIIPKRAVRLAGVDRWGWWELDPKTGEMIGVMESGQHQSMAEYKLSLDKVGLNDEMGFGIGAVIGATGTLFTISGLMLKYGEVTDEMVEEVKEWVKSLLCTTCVSKAEAKVGREITASVGGDCFKQSIKKDEAGANLELSFCDQYEKGFKCTSGILLAGLIGEGIQAGPEYEAGASMKLGCEEWKATGKANSGGTEFEVGDKKYKANSGG